MPSKWERMKVNKILHAIEMGWMKVDEEEPEEPEENLYDIWGEDFKDNLFKNLPPPLILPKTKRPGNQESYNPDKKYLLSAEQENEWKTAHPEDRELEYVPKKYDCLRKVECYDNSLKERFDRCLDLYLAPRVKKRKVHMNPDDLIPELPPASSLKPFPSFANVYFKGHESRVRTIKCSPNGNYLISGDEAGHCLLFDVKTSRILKRWKFTDTVFSIDWGVNELIAIGEGPRLHLINPNFGTEAKLAEVDYIVDEAKTLHGMDNDLVLPWEFYDRNSSEYLDEGKRFTITFTNNISQVMFHKKGEFIATLTPKASNNNQVFIHSLKKGKSQRPFVKAKSDIQRILFHHLKPILFLATKQTVWVFNLQTQVPAPNPSR
jgi:ribosome biogenesis protein ERB1